MSCGVLIRKMRVILHLSQDQVKNNSHRCSVNVDLFSPSSTQYHSPRLAAYKPKLAYRHDFAANCGLFSFWFFFNFRKTLQLNIFLKLQFQFILKNWDGNSGPAFLHGHMTVRVDCLDKACAIQLISFLTQPYSFPWVKCLTF